VLELAFRRPDWFNRKALGLIVAAIIIAAPFAVSVPVIQDIGHLRAQTLHILKPLEQYRPDYCSNVATMLFDSRVACHKGLLYGGLRVLAIPASETIPSPQQLRRTTLWDYCTAMEKRPCGRNCVTRKLRPSTIFSSRSEPADHYHYR